MSGGLIILRTFCIHSIVNDSSVLRCFRIGIAVWSVISVVAVVSSVEVVVIVVSPVVAVVVSGIELDLHVHRLPPAGVGAVAPVAPGGRAPVRARVISETKSENVYDLAREENICVGCKDVGIYSISSGDKGGMDQDNFTPERLTEK